MRRQSMIGKVSAHMSRQVAVASFALATGASALAAPIDLTQDATVRGAGTYTYFARGNAADAAVTPWTTKFYPGATLHAQFGVAATKDGTLTDAGGNTALPISIATGEVTDNDTSAGNYVAGWIDIEGLGNAGDGTPGDWDILFDLGALYNVTSVQMIYTSTGGARWTVTADVQQVFTAASFAGATPVPSDFTLFATGTAANLAAQTLTFDGADVGARYVNVRPVANISINPSGGSIGGYIHEIRIFGDIPEPGSAMLLTAAGAGLVLRRRRS